jgi:hypothetical protein
MRLSELHEESIGAISARWTPQKMTDQEMMDWAMKHAPKFLSQRKRIYRGAEDNIPNGLLDTTKLKRTSANSIGMYNAFIDRNWHGFPKRSESIICSSSEDDAELFGIIYLIIPEDSANIGICPENDIWGSFPVAYEIIEEHSLDTFETLISKLLSIEKPKLKGSDLRNPDLVAAELIRVKLEDIQKFKASENDFIDKSDIERMIAIMQKNNLNDLYDLFEFIFDPVKTGFRHITAENFNAAPNKEVWVSGKVLQIELESMSEEMREFFE